MALITWMALSSCAVPPPATVAETGPEKQQGSQMTAVEAVLLGLDEEKKKNHSKAFDYYYFAATKGHAWAENKVGEAYVSGIGTWKDNNSAIKWFKKASAQGNVEAKKNLIKLYFSEEQLWKNDADIASWIKNNAQHINKAEAKFYIGKAFLEGKGVERDSRRAFELIKDSAESGYIQSQYLLGWMYRKGEGTAKNIGQAIKWLDSAASDPEWSKRTLDDSPSNHARLELASIYLNGNGVPKDIKKALSLRQQAANHGSADAKNQLANMYLRGTGVKKNVPEAIRLYSEALVINERLSGAKSMLKIAVNDAYQKGEKAYKKRKYRTAFPLVKAAAEHGHSKAQYLLGVMFKKGQGTRSSPATAVKWWRKSTKQGNTAAFLPLGKALWNGSGITRDVETAKKLLLTSIVSGNKGSAKFMEEKVFHGWHYIISNKQAGMFFVNKNRISRKGDLRWYWFKTIPYPNVTNGQYDISTFTHTHGVFNCSSEEQASSSQTKYRSDGSAIESSTWPINKFSPVFPNSIGEGMFNYVCSGHKVIAAKKTLKKEKELVYIGTSWPVRDGYVVTNYHVIAKSTKLKLILTNGKTLSAKVATFDKANDIALLTVDDIQKLPPALPIASHPAGIGSKVFTIGYPHLVVMGSKPKLTNGIISSVSGMADDPRTYQISVPIQSGNSGGPLVNMHGQVVGIVTSKLNAVSMFKWTGDLPENVNYAIKAPYLKALLSSEGPSRKISELRVKSGSLKELAERIKGSVMIVVAQ